jgi:hypothetical protein
LSWQEARGAAAEWLASVGYPKRVDVSDQVVDLRPHLASLQESPAFRGMVLQAAERLLKARGAARVISE